MQTTHTMRRRSGADPAPAPHRVLPIRVNIPHHPCAATQPSEEREVIMATISKRFPLETVLSVTTGRLLNTKERMACLYDIIGFMVQGTPHTLTLAELGDPCAEELLRQHPKLADIKVPDFTREEDLQKRGQLINKWVAGLKIRYGRTLEVQAKPAQLLQQLR